MNAKTLYRRILPIGVVSSGAALRLIGLYSESFNFDEIISIHFVNTYSPIEFIGTYPTIDPHPPLYYIFLDFWSAMFGTSEFVSRFPSVIFGVGTIITVYLLGSQMFDSRVGLVGALFVSLSALHIYHSQEVRMYSLLTFFSALSYYFFIRFVKSSDQIRLFGYVISTVLLLYSHVFAAFVVLSQILYLLISRCEGVPCPDQHPRAWSKAYAIVGIFYAPIILIVLDQILLIRRSGAFISWIIPPTILSIPRSFLAYIGYQNETFMLLARGVPFLIFLIIPILWIVYRIIHRAKLFKSIIGFQVKLNMSTYIHDDNGNWENQTSWVLLLIIWIGTVHVIPWALSYLVTPIYVTRYTISASLGAYLLASVGVWMVVDRICWPSGLDRSIGIALVTILIISLALPLGGYYGTPQRDNWSDAIEYVDKRVDSDDAVLLVSDSPDLANLSVVYQYYNTGKVAQIYTVGSKIESSYRRVNSLSSAYDQVWLVIGLSHSVSDTERERYINIINKNCELRLNQKYTGVHIQAFDCN